MYMGLNSFVGTIKIVEIRNNAKQTTAEVLSSKKHKITRNHMNSNQWRRAPTGSYVAQVNQVLLIFIWPNVNYL